MKRFFFSLSLLFVVLFSYAITARKTTDFQTGSLQNPILTVDSAKFRVIDVQINKNDIRIWKAGETPRLSITVTSRGCKAQTFPCKVSLYRDRADEKSRIRRLLHQYQREIRLQAGETRCIDFILNAITKPGFYKFVASVNGDDIASYTIGYNPTAIGCKNDAQPDFEDYWAHAMAQLATVPINAQMKELPEYSSALRKVYEVSMKSVPDAPGEAPVTIRGWYAVPSAKGKYPALVQYQGTDDGKSPISCPIKGDDRPGWVELIISTRGQKLCRDDKYGYDFYSYFWGDTARHYYRNAYLDCVRAVDFIKSIDQVNQKELFATGASQGGCFTYVTAALTRAFRAIAPSVPGHADFRHGMDIVSWPRDKFLAAQKRLGLTDTQRDIFNSYYDTKNFELYG